MLRLASDLVHRLHAGRPSTAHAPHRWPRFLCSDFSTTSDETGDPRISWVLRPPGVPRSDPWCLFAGSPFPGHDDPLPPKVERCSRAVTRRAATCAAWRRSSSDQSEKNSS